MSVLWPYIAKLSPKVDFNSLICTRIDTFLENSSASHQKYSNFAYTKTIAFQPAVCLQKFIQKTQSNFPQSQKFKKFIRQTTT